MAGLVGMSGMRFKQDGERYIVFLGDDRIGFVKRDGKLWNAVDTFMEKSADRPSRDKAAIWLRRVFERAAKEGRATGERR